MDSIVTCVQRLSWDDLRPFVLSARRFAPTARLVMFVNAVPPQTLTTLRDHGVTLHPFSALFPVQRRRTEWVRLVLVRGAVQFARRLRYPQFCRRLQWTAGALLLWPVQARFCEYLMLIEDTGITGDRYLLCDARDLVFQADPFPQIPHDGIIVGQEESDVPLASNPFNELWYRKTYGRRALAKIAKHPVVCAGMIAGGRDALIPLLAEMSAEAMSRPIGYAHEQAILNHLVRFGQIPMTVAPNRSALVWHMFGVPPSELRITPENVITDPTGYVYPIVHMYDRHPTAAAAVKTRWS